MRFCNWVRNNKNIVALIGALIIAIPFVMAYFAVEDANPFVLIITYAILSVIVMWWLINLCDIHYARFFVDQYNENCDPEAYLEYLEQELKRSKDDIRRQIYYLDYTTCLEALGEHERAYQMLSDMNIDRFPSMPLAFKVLYYEKLSENCHRLGNFELADVWHAKGSQMVGDIKAEAQRNDMQRAVSYGEVRALIRKKEYSAAAELLNGMPLPKKKIIAVDHATLCAEICIATGDTENEMGHLQFIADNGNKMAVASWARERLEKMK